jgi:mannose-6-phosphate isomerase-like protein (cupin superfamily)
MSHLTFGPNRLLTVGHRHPGGEEIYVLVSGAAEIKIDDNIFEMEAASAVRVTGDRFRGIRAVGDEPAVVIVVGYPVDDPASTEIIEDFWPRS